MSELDAGMNSPRVRAVKSWNALPDTPDVVVIAAPPPDVLSMIAAAGAKGAAAAIIVTAGLGHGPGSLAGQCKRAALSLAAAPYNVFCLSPHSLQV
jgi:acyl-CoA synthetase (NDP forming)